MMAHLRFSRDADVMNPGAVSVSVAVAGRLGRRASRTQVVASALLSAVTRSRRGTPRFAVVCFGPKPIRPLWWWNADRLYLLPEGEEAGQVGLLVARNRVHWDHDDDHGRIASRRTYAMTINIDVKKSQRDYHRYCRMSNGWNELQWMGIWQPAHNAVGRNEPWRREDPRGSPVRPRAPTAPHSDPSRAVPHIRPQHVPQHLHCLDCFHVFGHSSMQPPRRWAGTPRSVGTPLDEEGTAQHLPRAMVTSIGVWRCR
jgi:hypothetical protein